MKCNVMSYILLFALTNTLKRWDIVRFEKLEPEPWLLFFLNQLIIKIVVNFPSMK